MRLVHQEHVKGYILHIGTNDNQAHLCPETNTGPKSMRAQEDTLGDYIPLPTALKKVLDMQDIEYQCICTSEASEALAIDRQPRPPEALTIQSVLLQDEIGKTQVLLPRDRVLNLSLVCEKLGRNFHALKPAEEQKIARSLGFQFIPALPEATSYATVVDESLHTKPTLYLESGTPGVYVKISQQNFKVFCAQSSTMNCCKLSTAFSPKITTLDLDVQDIGHAVEQFTALRIKQRLETTLEIPPMPSTAKKIIKLRVDPDAGVGELAQLVETDPSLAAQVISWASSPYYAAPGKVSSVHDAVVRVLGFDLVINLALGIALGKTLSLPEDQSHGARPYWQQAVLTAATMEALVKTLPKKQRPSIGLCYLSGLLHNFGFLVLGHVFPPHLALVNRHIEANPHLSHTVVENFLLGITRDQICAWLFTNWCMPGEVIAAIKYQNLPDYQEALHSYPNLLCISNQLLKAQQLGIDAETMIQADLLERTGLAIADAQEACAKVLDNLDPLNAMAKNLENSQ